MIFEKLVKWFQINLLSPNLNETYYMQFMSKNNHTDDISIHYKTIQINNVYCTNFLGLTLDITLSWKPHIDKLISKGNSHAM
jgi:hypothetical protein